MITDGILDFFFGIITFVFGLLPNGDTSLNLNTNMSSLAAANTVLPIDYLFLLLGISIPIMITGLAFWSMFKLFNMIRGSGA
jgi:hypothetical protein